MSEMEYKELKILPEYFQSVITWSKKFEIRKNDRDFKVGDVIKFREWDGKEYTGRKMFIQISYVLKDVPEYGLKDGYCIFCWQKGGVE